MDKIKNCNSEENIEFTRDDLKNFIFMKSEIFQLEQELKSIREGFIDKELQNPDNKINLVRLIEIYDKLKYKKEQLVLLLEKIEDSIEELCPMERVLIREYYINGNKWEEVADKIGYSWAQTHRHHKAALEKLLG